MFEFFENEQASAFGDGRAGRIFVKWPQGGGRRIVVLFGEAFEQRLPHQAHGIHFGFRPAADGQIGIPALDRAKGFADGQMRGGFGTGDGVAGAF